MGDPAEVLGQDERAYLFSKSSSNSIVGRVGWLEAGPLLDAKTSSSTRLLLKSRLFFPAKSLGLHQAIVLLIEVPSKTDLFGCKEDSAGKGGDLDSMMC